MSGIKVVWRARAVRQLTEIHQYIAARNESAADAYATGVRDLVSKLADFPDQGRRYDRRYRLLVHRNHLIFYRHSPESAQVTVVAVLDARRDVAALFPPVT